MNRSIMTIAIALTGAILAAGCSSQPEIKNANLAQEELKALKQDKNETFLNVAPDWAIELAGYDENGIYAVGIAESDNLYTATKKATLRAEYALAGQVQQEISGSERQYLKSSGSSTSTEEFYELIDKLVASVPITGYQTTDHKVVPVNGNFTSFVRVKLTYDQVSNILAQMYQANVDLSPQVKELFNELETRVQEKLNKRMQGQTSMPEITNAGN